MFLGWKKGHMWAKKKKKEGGTKLLQKEALNFSKRGGWKQKQKKKKKKDAETRRKGGEKKKGCWTEQRLNEIFWAFFFFPIFSEKIMMNSFVLDLIFSMN